MEKQSATEILAELMLRREMKDEQTKAANEARLAVKLVRQQQADADSVKNENRRHANCDHLQGNHKNGEAPFREISHLSLHTYGGPSTEDNRRIRCNKCGAKWYPGDTAEIYCISKLRGNDEKLPNPTVMSWKDAYKTVMRNKSQGNKPSSGFIDVMLTPPQE